MGNDPPCLLPKAKDQKGENGGCANEANYVNIASVCNHPMIRLRWPRMDDLVRGFEGNKRLCQRRRHTTRTVFRRRTVQARGKPCEGGELVIIAGCASGHCPGRETPQRTVKATSILVQILSRWTEAGGTIESVSSLTVSALRGRSAALRARRVARDATPTHEHLAIWASNTGDPRQACTIHTGRASRRRKTIFTRWCTSSADPRRRKSPIRTLEEALVFQ